MCIRDRHYGINDKELTAYLEYEGQILRFEVEDKSLTRPTNTDKITLLTCTRNYAEEQTTEVVEVRYINSKEMCIRDRFSIA